MTDNFITKVRLPNGTEIGFVDWSDIPLHSTCDFAHGFVLQELALFGYTEGEQVPAAAPAGVAALRRTATRFDTNGQVPGSMASTENRLVYSVKPEYFALTAEDVGPPFNFDSAVSTPSTGEPMCNPVMLKTLQHALMLRLEVSQKFFQQAGLGYFNTGFGVLAGSSTTTGAAALGRTYANAGLPSQEAVRGFVVPTFLGGQEAFKVSVLNPQGRAVNFGNSENGAVDTNTAAVVQMRVYLEGLYKRGVS